LDPLTVFSDIPTPVWAAASGAISGIGTWIVSMRQIGVSVERARIKMVADASADESAERAAFRATLMADISNLRLLMKECEVDRDFLRTRVNATEEQILVLKASNEIMERWLAFFKDRNAMDVRAASGQGQADAST
jgi:hypothetical protein